MVDSLEVFINKGGFMQPPTTQPEDVKKDMAEIIKNSPFGHLQYISLSITTTMTYNPGGNRLVVFVEIQ